MDVNRDLIPDELVAKPLRSYLKGTQPKLTFLVKGKKAVDFNALPTIQGVADFAMSVGNMTKD